MSPSLATIPHPHPPAFAINYSSSFDLRPPRAHVAFAFEHGRLHLIEVFLVGGCRCCMSEEAERCYRVIKFERGWTRSIR